MLNIDLLLKTMDHIEQLEALREEGNELDEVWTQGWYRGPIYPKMPAGYVMHAQNDVQFERCQTGMCFAGWAAQFAGGRWKYDTLGGGDPTILVADEDNGWPEEMAAIRAIRVLGISYGTADYLFAGGNRLPMLRTIVDMIIDNRAQSDIAGVWHLARRL